MSTEVDFEINEGKTFKAKVLWQGTKYIHVPIASISNGGPVLVETTLPHNAPDGWPVAIVAAKGLVELNASKNPPAKSDYRAATFVSATEIEFNQLNGAGYGTHQAGTGFLQYLEPMPLTGTVPRWVVRDKTDGTLIIEATVANGGIVINTVEKCYEIIVDVDKTTALAIKKGVHELETVDPSLPFTYKVIHGKITVVQELAT